MRGDGFIKPKNTDKIHVIISDRELISKLAEYGERKNMNISLVVRKLCICKDNIDGLIEGIEREKYELLDEDEKIDMIIKLTNIIESHKCVNEDVKEDAEDA